MPTDYMQLTNAQLCEFAEAYVNNPYCSAPSILVDALVTRLKVATQSNELLRAECAKLAHDAAFGRTMRDSILTNEQWLDKKES